MLSCNIVLLKHIAQHSIQFLTDSNWLITKSIIQIQDQFSFIMTQHILFSWYFSLFYILHANYLGGVCNQLKFINFWIHLYTTIFCSIFQYISIYFDIYNICNICNICEYLTDSLPSCNDVNLFVLLFNFHFRCYFSG